MVGLIYYLLPGLFHGNPAVNVVNGSLWTVPIEILCYITMAIIIVTKMMRYGWSLVPMAILILATSTAAEYIYHLHPF